MKTKVWRTFNDQGINGMFIWEVNECDDTTDDDAARWPSTYLKCRDGSYVLIPHCFHFWSENKASEFFYGSYSNYQEIVPIGEGPVPF